MTATTAVRVSVKERAMQYLQMWYIGKTVETLNDIAEKATEETLKALGRMGDKQIIHTLNHSNILTDTIERLAKDQVYEKSLNVCRPAKRDAVDVNASKVSQAKANEIVSELLYVNPFDVVRYNSTDGLHCVTATRGISNYALVKFDGRVIRHADHLMRLVRKYDWTKAKE